MKAILIAGAPINNYSIITSSINDGDYIVCADSGLTHAANMGLKVDLAVGDFDSYNGKVVSNKVVRLPCKKDDTDAMAAARLIIEGGFKEVLMIGCTGARLDHTLGAISALIFLVENGCQTTMLDDTHQITAVCGGSYNLSVPVGTTFSLIPFGCDRVEGVTVDGAEYALRSATMYADQPLGVSNVAACDSVKISLERGRLLVIVPKN